MNQRFLDCRVHWRAGVLTLVIGQNQGLVPIGRPKRINRRAPLPVVGNALDTGHGCKAQGGLGTRGNGRSHGNGRAGEEHFIAEIIRVERRYPLAAAEGGGRRRRRRRVEDHHAIRNRISRPI